MWNEGLLIAPPTPSTAPHPTPEARRRPPTCPPAVALGRQLLGGDGFLAPGDSGWGAVWRRGAGRDSPRPHGPNFFLMATEACSLSPGRATVVTRAALGKGGRSLRPEDT